MERNIKYRVGQIVGNSLMLRESESVTKNRKAVFECSYCRKEFVAFINNVKRGTTSSCGCQASRNFVGIRSTTHGNTSVKGNTTEFNTWSSMKARCYNKRNKSYKIYGGRGIIVCDRWLNNFHNFLKDMGRKPSAKHSIDRINNAGNYEPGNCKWATSTEQNQNKSNVLKVTFNGVEKPLIVWCKELGISHQCVSSTKSRRKKSAQEAFDLYCKN